MFHTNEDDYIYYTYFAVVRPGFSQASYDESEGPDRRSALPNMPCHVVVYLKDTVIETPLKLQLIPRTFSENIAVSGPLPHP